MYIMYAYEYVCDNFNGENLMIPLFNFAKTDIVKSELNKRNSFVTCIPLTICPRYWDTHIMMKHGTHLCG